MKPECYVQRNIFWKALVPIETDSHDFVTGRHGKSLEPDQAIRDKFV